MSKYTPVPAIMPAVAFAAQRASQGLDSLPTNAATVIMFGRPGLAGRGVPGLFAQYHRTTPERIAS